MLRTPGHHITVVHTDSGRAAAGEEIELEPSIRSTNRSYNHHPVSVAGVVIVPHIQVAHTRAHCGQTVCLPLFPF